MTKPPSVESSEWVRIQTMNGRWQVRQEFALPPFLTRLENPENLMEPPAVPLRTDGRQRPTSIVSLYLPEFPTTPLAVKQYHPPGFWRALKLLLRPGRGTRGFARALFLEKNHVPTARPIAAGEIKCRGLPSASYLITEYLRETTPLRHFRRVEREPRRDRELVRELGRLMGHLHKLLLIHTDPSLSNFLVRKDQTPRLRLVLVDVDGLRPVARLTHRHVVDDLRRVLRRIPMSERERLWFAAEYCARRGDDGGARELLSALG